MFSQVLTYGLRRIADRYKKFAWRVILTSLQTLFFRFLLAQRSAGVLVPRRLLDWELLVGCYCFRFCFLTCWLFRSFGGITVTLFIALAHVSCFLPWNISKPVGQWASTSRWNRCRIRRLNGGSPLVICCSCSLVRNVFDFWENRRQKMFWVGSKDGGRGGALGAADHPDPPPRHIAF